MSPRLPQRLAARLFLTALSTALALGSASATTGTMTLTADTTLTENHFGDIILAADGIILDCDNHAVIGSGTGIGIDVVGRSGVLVVNCHAENHGVGFRIESTVNSQFLLNSAAFNTSTTGGFYVNACPSNVTVSMNRSFANAVGRGFTVRDSSKVKLKSNSAVANGFRGFDVGNSDDIDLSKNTADGNGSGGFVVFGCTDVKLRQNISTNSGSEGFALLSLDDGTIKDNGALYNGSDGFRLGTGTGNVLRKNRAEENGTAGFRIGGSGNLLKHNASFLNGPPADMADPSCPSPVNTWTSNFFGTATCPAIN